jgi:hypothetical protein
LARFSGTFSAELILIFGIIFGPFSTKIVLIVGTIFVEKGPKIMPKIRIGTAKNLPENRAKDGG